MRGRLRLSVIRVGILFSISLGITKIVYADIPIDPADLLFESFASKCDSQGQFTSQALSETIALEQMMKTIVNDSSCQGLTPVLNQLTSVSNQLSFLDNGFDGEQQMEMQNYIKQLTLNLAVTTDPTLQEQISAEIASTRWTLLQKSHNDTIQMRTQRSATIKQLMQYMSLLSSAYPNQALCFSRHKELPFQLIGQLSSLAGGFFGADVNAALVLAGQLFSAIMDFISNEDLMKAIQNYRRTKLQQGLTCAMEALEKTVCDVQDYESLLKFHKKYKSAPQVPEEWLGYDLYKRQFPILQNFLDQVEGGTTVQSDADASLRAGFRTMEAQFRSNVVIAQGSFATTRKKLRDFEKQSTPVAIVQQFKSSFVSSLTGNLASSTIVTQLLPQDDPATRLELWLRIGNPQPDLSGITGTDDSDKLRQKLLQVQKQDVNIDDVEKNFNIITQQATTLLNSERSTVFNPDPQGALLQWSVSDAKVKDSGAILENIIHYLTALQTSWSNHPEWFSNSSVQQDQLAYVQTTVAKFQTTLDTLLDRKLTDDKKLSKIFEAMSLDEYGLISERFKAIVELDLQKRLAQGIFSSKPSLETFLRLNSDDLLVSLFPNANNTLERVNDDLMGAEVIAKANLKNFFDYFRDSILNSFQLLQKDANLWHEKWDGPNNRRIAKICILALNAPQLASNEFKPIRDWCGPHALQAQAGSSVLTVRFADLVKRQPDDRICAFKRYQDEVDLAESILKNGVSVTPKSGTRNSTTPTTDVNAAAAADDFVKALNKNQSNFHSH